MPKTIRIHQPGGPEVLMWEEVEVGKPGAGEAHVRNTAVGLNYVDVYVRKGLYPVSPPSGLGTEAAGVVEEVGPNVTDVKPGDRVAYAVGPLGAYSEVRVIPADRLVVLPDGISDQQAAAMMLKGLTVQYLIRQIHKVDKGDTILFHAAAGGLVSLRANGRSRWAPSLSARSAVRKRRRSLKRTAATTPSSIRGRTSCGASARLPKAKSYRWSTTLWAKTPS
jgi:NADPH2:quinone reductase